jgi:hypothetical protein
MPQIIRQRGTGPRRHQVGIPGDIISEYRATSSRNARATSSESARTCRSGCAMNPNTVAIGHVETSVCFRASFAITSHHVSNFCSAGFRPADRVKNPRLIGRFSEPNAGCAHFAPARHYREQHSSRTTASPIEGTPHDGLESHDGLECPLPNDPSRFQPGEHRLEERGL